MLFNKILVQMDGSKPVRAGARMNKERMTNSLKMVGSLSEDQRRQSREERRLRLRHLQTISRRDIDKSRKIVVIGLGTGGLYASRAASKTDRQAKITIIEKRDYDMFSPCGLPYAIEGRVQRFEDLKHSVPSSRHLIKLLQHEALFIDTKKKRK